MGFMRSCRPFERSVDSLKGVSMRDGCRKDRISITRCKKELRSIGWRTVETSSDNIGQLS